MDIRYQYDAARSNGLTPEQAANYVRDLARRCNPEMKKTQFDQIFLEQEAARDLNAMHHEIGQAEMRFISRILQWIEHAEHRLEKQRRLWAEWSNETGSQAAEMCEGFARQIEEWEATVNRLNAQFQAVQDRRIIRLYEMQAEGLAIS